MYCNTTNLSAKYGHHDVWAPKYMLSLAVGRLFFLPPLTSWITWPGSGAWESPPFLLHCAAWTTWADRWLMMLVAPPRHEWHGVWQIDGGLTTQNSLIILSFFFPLTHTHDMSISPVHAISCLLYLVSCMQQTSLWFSAWDAQINARLPARMLALPNLCSHAPKSSTSQASLYSINVCHHFSTIAFFFTLF